MTTLIEIDKMGKRSKIFPIKGRSVLNNHLGPDAGLLPSTTTYGVQLEEDPKTHIIEITDYNYRPPKSYVVLAGGEVDVRARNQEVLFTVFNHGAAVKPD